MNTSFNGLLVLAALLTNPQPPEEPTETVSVPIVQPPPAATPVTRLIRGETCPPLPTADQPWPALVASLVGGCQTTSEQQFRYAVARQVPFLNTEAEYPAHVASGRLVRLEGPFVHVLARRPYVLPSTAAFVNELATAYHSFGCGRLIIRDAFRLTTERPSNGSLYSVHPAGMAVDIRVNGIDEQCESWLTTYFLAKEAEGVVDATREYWKMVRRQRVSNPHFHIVVPPEPRISEPPTLNNPVGAP
jgi:hypothetical protein